MGKADCDAKMQDENKHRVNPRGIAAWGRPATLSDNPAADSRQEDIQVRNVSRTDLCHSTQGGMVNPTGSVVS